MILKDMSSLPIGDFQGNGKTAYDNSTKLTPPVPIVSTIVLLWFYNDNVKYV